MTIDRLQAAWRYANAEIWRPLFDRFRDEYPDLPIEIVRTMLVRPPGMPQIFVEPGKVAALDRLRGDVATYLDSPEDARSALRRIKPPFFTGGRAIAVLLSDIAAALREYASPNLDEAYRDRIARFLQRHALPYRLDSAPLKLVTLLHEEVDAIYRDLRTKANEDARLQEALSAFENAWARQVMEWSQVNAKDAIRTASLLAENVLISSSDGRANDYTKALNRMRIGNRFPSNDFANIFDRAYTFANNYPNIRHPGNENGVLRELSKEDTLLAALVFVGLSACAGNM